MKGGRFLLLTNEVLEHVQLIWASTQEILILLHAKNKGADQAAHMRSLVSAFVIRSLERRITQLATCKISPFYLVSVAEQFTNPEDRFSCVKAHICPHPFSRPFDLIY